MEVATTSALEPLRPGELLLHRRVLLGAIKDISFTARRVSAAPQSALEPAGEIEADRHEAKNIGEFPEI